MHSVDCHTCSHSCQNCHTPMPSYVKPLELICSLAFAIFGALVAPGSFTLFFTIGVCYESFLNVRKINFPSETGARPSCGQGNGELLAGRGLLQFEIVAVTALLFFEHLQHHPEFFVPFLAFWLGVRAVYHLQIYQ